MFALFVALLKRAIVRLHFLHFSKVQQKVKSHNRSFAVSECAKMCEKIENFKIVLVLQFKISNRTFLKCAIVQP